MAHRCSLEAQRFDRPMPAEGPFARRFRGRFASCIRATGPEKWTPAHTSKAACANELPAWLSAKRTAAFGSSAHGRVERRRSAPILESWQGQFQGQSGDRAAFP